MQTELHLERRLKQLEREVRWFRAVAALVLLGGTVLLSTRAGSAPPKDGGVTRLHAPFEVVGARDTPLMRVREEPGSGTACVLFNQKGAPVARIVASATGGMVEISRRQGQPVAQMDAATGQLMFVRNGRAVASMGLSADGGGSLRATSYDQKQWAELVASDKMAGVETGEQLPARGAGHMEYRALTGMYNAEGSGHLFLNKGDKPAFTAP